MNIPCPSLSPAETKTSSGRNRSPTRARGSANVTCGVSSSARLRAQLRSAGPLADHEELRLRAGVEHGARGDQEVLDAAPARAGSPS
jgi:hypothetical protein